MDEFEYLGVIIDFRLSFTSHIRDVCMKINRARGVIYSVRNMLSQSTLRILYYSLAYPYIINSVIIWGGVSETKLRDLKVAINKLLRTILRVRTNVFGIPLMPVSEMYKNLGLLKFSDVYKYFMLKFLHVVLYENRKLYDSYFAQYLPSHNYVTRNCSFNIPRLRTEIERLSIVYQCILLSREIPRPFLDNMNKYTMREKFYEYILDRY